MRFNTFDIKNTQEIVLPDENLSLMQLTPADIGFISGGDANVKPTNEFNLGDVIILPSTSVEDMTFGGIMFRLIAKINQYKETDINSYILKEVYQDENGEIKDANELSKRNKLTMNRHMCSLLGIQYERGLELWPDYLNFIRYDDLVNNNKSEKRKLDYSNIGTYPVNEATGCLGKICIELLGFKINNIDRSTFVTTPTGNTLRIEDFLRSLTFRAKIIKQQPIVVAKQISPTKDGKNKSSIFFEVDMSPFMLHPSDVEGLNIDDLLRITWREESRNNSSTKIVLNICGRKVEVETSSLIDTHNIENRADAIYKKLNHYLDSIERENARIDRELRNLNVF